MTVAAPPPPVSLDRYRRLVPYMTYYVAQGLSQGLSQRPSALQGLQGLQPVGPVNNGLEPYTVSTDI